MEMVADASEFTPDRGESVGSTGLDSVTSELPNLIVVCGSGSFGLIFGLTVLSESEMMLGHNGLSAVAWRLCYRCQWSAILGRAPIRAADAHGRPGGLPHDEMFVLTGRK